MHLVVISHKLCWPSPDSPSGYVTDGGFPLQMEAISELFDTTHLVVPCENEVTSTGVSPLRGRMVRISPLTVPYSNGIWRKIDMMRWITINGRIIWRAVRDADAVHTPIPGDVGTFGMFFALILRKRLFVRYCGNWSAPRTIAERFWKWSMEAFAGGRNVMIATGGSSDPPSKRNANVSWIFSTSLRDAQIKNNFPKEPPLATDLRLIIACRQEKRKGTEVVIAALPSILLRFKGVSLEVVGGGSLLEDLKKQAHKLGLQGRVNFRGKVEQSRVIELLKSAHLFCYPTASEGFPKVVLEALASGLPVITTKVSVLPQLLASNCGRLLDEPSAANLTKAVDEICGNPDTYSLMSRNAIATAQQYSLEAWRDEIGSKLRKSWNLNSLGGESGGLVQSELE